MVSVDIWTQGNFTEPGEAVLYEKKGHTVVITLNRPDSLNAINRQLRGELGGAILRYDEDDDARVAIITGAGRAFCAGRDLKERAADNAAGVQARASASMGTQSPYMWPQTWKPLIAAVNGYALAGGWMIAQICDIRLAAEEAMLGITEPRVGLLPPFAVTLPKLMPMAAVMELVMTADPVTAQRACEMGFINKVVPGDRLMDEAMSLSERIVANAPLSLKYFKEATYRGLDMGAQEVMPLTYQMYERLLLTEDAIEGPKAFAEKRKPRWIGR
ncbi:MAG: enoyl-CoA hydratase/isomerase family protein [Dehalococcoidia bacterium]|nr:enoyl-CoA hydratase/isomerase family protein [Dehalococcoidia bacterium]